MRTPTLLICVWLVTLVAAAEAKNASVCTDAPPPSRDAALAASVHRAVKRTLKPDLPRDEFIRAGELPDRALAIVPIRRARSPRVRAKTLLYLATHCATCHLAALRACWPNALRRSRLLRSADLLLYAGCRGPAGNRPGPWATALAALPTRNVTLAWTRWNPGYQEGAMAAVMVAARKGWFESYAWILRANPDVRIEDASFLAARLRKPTVDAVLVRCRPRAPSICTDFFAARPSAMNHSAWGRSRKKNGRVNNVPTQRPGVRASTCSVDRWRRRSPVDGRRSSPRTTYSGAPSRAGPRRSGMSSVRTGRGAAAAAAWVDAGSITTTRCADGRGSVRKFCTGNKYLI